MWGQRTDHKSFLGPLWTKAYLFQPHWACPTLLRPLLTLWDLYLCVFACLCAYVCELWRNNWHEEIWIIVFIHTLLIFQTLKLQYLGNLTVSYPFYLFIFFLNFFYFRKLMNRDSDIYLIFTLNLKNLQIWMKMN